MRIWTWLPGLLAGCLLGGCSKNPGTNGTITTNSSPAPASALQAPTATILATPGSNNAAGDLIEKGFTVRNAGHLFLKFPKSWKDSIQKVQELDRVLDGVKFKPSSGDDFALMVEVINVGEKNAEQLDLQSVLTNAAGSDLTNAVQQSLEIHDLAGPQVKGCYFVLMDKSRTIAAPKPGEYLFLTQGYARVANVILNFRLVSNHLAPEQDQALELIRTAKFAKMR